MASSIFQTAKRLRNFTQVSDATRAGILSRIGPIGNPRISLVPALEQWFREGQTIYRYEFRDVIRSLRRQKRFKHALEFCEWIAKNGIFSFGPTDCALELDLIGAFRGLDSAEAYFNSLSDEFKTRETYGALLSCYVKHRSLEKSLRCFQTAKSHGLAAATSYTGIMSLYVRTDQPSKVPSVIAMMMKDGVCLDGFSYRVWVSSYGSRSDLDRVEKISEEIEIRRPSELDWKFYDAVANFHLRTGDPDKFLLYLKKSELLLLSHENDRSGLTVLISQYGRVGRRDEMARLWALQGERFPSRSNTDYVAMLGLLVRLGDVGEAENVVAEWESSCRNYDFRVPEILLHAYCRIGRPEKAEARLVEMIERGSGRGRSPEPSGWAVVAGGYLEARDMVKALECVERALVLRSENEEKRLGVRVPAAVLEWLGYNGDIDRVEAYVGLMKKAFPVSREMYHCLITAYVRKGEPVGAVLERMKCDGFDLDDEAQRLLNLYSSDSDIY